MPPFLTPIKRLLAILALLGQFLCRKLYGNPLPPDLPAPELEPTATEAEETETPKMDEVRLGPLNRSTHVAHAKRCMSALPKSQTDLDASRLAIAFYCIGILDLLGVANDKTAISEYERECWVEWLWAQQTHGECGSGFRPSSFMALQPPEVNASCSDYNGPHIIMTYTALLSLAILRDDFSKLDRDGLIAFIRSCQREDGSFSTVAGDGEFDVRTLYCAFAISAMLDDWSGVNVENALRFIASCRTYEGGYGQAPFCEAQGGTTYIALASMHLASAAGQSQVPLTPEERKQTIRWLVSNQTCLGGFAGRTGKDGDACYCFWCGASLKILGVESLVDPKSLASFLSECQFKFGGISKCPSEQSDPYHTYLSLAALSMYPPLPISDENEPESWNLPQLDPLLNARIETAEWAKKFISGKGMEKSLDSNLGVGVGVDVDLNVNGQ